MNRNDTPIFAYADNLYLFKKNLSIKDVQAKNSDGYNILHYLCNNNYFECLGYLLFFFEKKLDNETFKVFVNEQDPEGYTALMICCSFNLLECLQTLLKCKVLDLNFLDKKNEKNTALQHACLSNNVCIVRILLSDPRININEVNTNNETALDLASYEDKISCVEYLLKQKNIQVNIVNNRGETALTGAFENDCFESIMLLLEHPDTDINYVNLYGDCAFTYTCNSEILVGDDVIFDMLMSNKKLNINVRDSEGNTPLHLLVKRENVRCAIKLLKNPNVDVNAKNNLGETPLHIICKYPSKINNIQKANFVYFNLLNLLLSTPNIDINAENNLGETPFFCLCSDSSNSMNEHIDNFILEILSTRENLDINKKNKDGYSPLHMASKYNKKKFVLFLVQKENIIINE